MNYCTKKKPFFAGVVLLFVCFLSLARAQTSPSVSVEKPVTPLFLNDENPSVLKVEIKNSREDRFLEELTVSLGQGGDKVAGVTVYYSGNSNEFSKENIFGEQIVHDSSVAVAGRQKLKSGSNYFWIGLSLEESASLSDGIMINTEKLTVNSEQFKIGSDRPDTPLRTALKVRKKNQDGVHTYRIPGLATTNEGTLIATYDIRHENAADLQGDIDVGVSRSTDGGKSWEPMQTIMDRGDWGGRPEEENGVGDPAVLVDRESGTIWIAALWTHGMPGERAWTGSGPGMEPDETGQVLLVKSEDDGKTWSEPINITGQIKDPDWHLVLPGPGKGITMKDGTLVFAAQFKDENEMPHSTVMYSKDGGETWRVGNSARPNTTEAQVVELEDGSLMLNMRDNRGKARSVYTTDNLGNTWSRHSTSRKDLPEPISMASLDRFTAELNGSKKQLLAFSNPNSTSERVNMTVKLSPDMGNSWPLNQQMLLDEHSGFGYSCLTPIDGQTIGILYEGVRELYFQRIKIKDLLPS